MQYRVNEDGRLLWKEDAKRVVQEPAVLELRDAQLRSMQQAIGDGTPESELIRAIHCHFVGE
jgi:hypothetical protein